ncbi:hypothetical protein [Manganibacter manganicus]|uniref:Uncharacterized protein n=1 Tax=Manganibacter manganicus TaxID=1873176 RepID=A0A1V8RJH7_9HYPH|nr:hypothetical protein [Pseudaminobacter manganicus]OQM73365.1 hypothetical protein BFN67_08670 [Pseudaminobacter manganicus]
MRSRRCTTTAIALVLAVLASGCGTPREKTAPCKRPANLTSYASTGDECGPMKSINADSAAALAAIQDLASGEEE